MSVAREDVSFDSGGERIAAWFYPGEGDGTGRRPCIVIGHGFAAVKEARLDAFAERFAAAGFACLVFDYRHFGASGGMPRQVIDIGHQRRDWDAALRYARSLKRVDADHIGIWGTSFGGGLALELAARDGGVRAAVFHLPLVDSFAASRYEGFRHTVLSVVLGFWDLAHGLLRRPPFLVPVVGPPGSRAIMVTPSRSPATSRSCKTHRRGGTRWRRASSSRWLVPAREPRQARALPGAVRGRRTRHRDAAGCHAGRREARAERARAHAPRRPLRRVSWRAVRAGVAAETAFFEETLQGVRATQPSAAG